MLIAEPYEASICAPKDLTVLGYPCLKPSSNPAHTPGGSFQPSLRLPALPWEMLEVSLCSNCFLNYHSGLTLHLAGGQARAWWSLGCHLNPTLLTNTERPSTCQACFSTGVQDKCIWTFFFQGLTFFLFFLNSQTSEIPMNSYAFQRPAEML